MGHKGKKNASELVRASDLHEILQPLAAVRLVEAGSDAAGVQRRRPAHGTGEAFAASQELERRVGHHEADGGTGSRHLAFADKDLELQQDWGYCFAQPPCWTVQNFKAKNEPTKSRTIQSANFSAT